MDTFFVRRQMLIGAIVFACLEVSLMLFRALGH
jgi:hypothetical protein